ncbi:MAG: PEGA domain-containing protein, partial [Rhodothermales bacterium]|nr:PEGA domain-containing protein [Rhodothermales bacterium]
MSIEKESPEPRSIEDYQAPLWAPPPPPAFGEREWFSLIFERYGFALASLLTLSVILVLFLNADLLLKRPTGEGEAAADIAVSVVSQPASATVLIDGDSVGVAPLYGYGLAPGTYLLSLRAPGRGAVDTVITVPGAGTDFAFRLPYAGARPAGLGPERLDAPIARDDEAGPPPSTETTGATAAAVAAGEGEAETPPEPPRRATPPASEVPRAAEPDPQRPEPQVSPQEDAPPEEKPEEEAPPEG